MHSLKRFKGCCLGFGTLFWIWRHPHIQEELTEVLNAWLHPYYRGYMPKYSYLRNVITFPKKDLFFFKWYLSPFNFRCGVQVSILTLMFVSLGSWSRTKWQMWLVESCSLPQSSTEAGYVEHMLHNYLWLLLITACDNFCNMLACNEWWWA